MQNKPIQSKNYYLHASYVVAIIKTHNGSNIVHAKQCIQVIQVN